jgi:N-acetylglucosamine kinase-like BadF-type ATPase
MTRIVLGMDIGGTKSHAVLADETGRVLGEGVGGSGNINFIPLEMAERSFAEAIGQAQRQAGIDRLETEIAVVGIEPQVEPLHPCLKRLANPKRIERHEEGECSLVGGLVEKTGIAMIAGTGSVGWGRNAEGRTHVTSCWGPIGDEGSAYWLAVRGINAAFRADDGRGPPTNMVERIIQKIGGPTLRACVTPLYTSQDFRREVSQYCKIVMELATSDPPDGPMREIVDEGAEEIAHFLATCAEVLGLHKAPYKVVAGSLVINVPYYWRQVEQRLRRRHPHTELVMPRFSPGVGAALIALNAIGVSWSKQVIDNLEKTCRKSNNE